MTIAGNTVNLGYGEDKATTTTSLGRELGTRGETPDGRVFWWSFSNSTIGAGNLVQSKAPTALHDMDLAIQAARAIGARTIAVTLGATLATIDQYASGYIYINDGAGEGHIYRVAGPAGTGGTAGNAHAAADSAATLTLNLAGNEQVREALTTGTSKAGLMENPYKDCATWATTAVGTLLGVATTEIADNTYFWAQGWGMAAVLVDGTVVLSQETMASDNLAGAAEAQNYGGTVELPTVGVVTGVVAADTTFQYMDLKIRS